MIKISHFALIAVVIACHMMPAELYSQDTDRPAANLPICVGLTTHDGKAEAFFNRNEGWIATWKLLGDSELGTGARMDPEHLHSIVLVDRKTKDESHINY